MKRIAAYCRVSTDKIDQINSLESQKKYFTEYIERNPLWELIEIYVDEGITGTNTKKRHNFNRMINDARNKKFDIILTKEISRFARNTLDSISYTRELKDLGIGVIFINDNINTLDPDSEFRLTMMASIAQEESRKTSERVKWGQKQRMKSGVVFGLSMLGYDVKNGKMTINPEGTEIVKLIFHKFVNEGKGTHIIARELHDSGIKTKNNKTEWSNTVILRILKNEKYVGDLTQQKTYTPNYLSHQKKYNKGELELITIKNHHEPIIDRETFEKAQKEIARRSPTEEQRSKHSNRYCFSGKIKCGYCGKTFVSQTKKRNYGTYKAWKCGESAKNGKKHTDTFGNEIGCDGRQVNNNDLMEVMKEVVKKAVTDKQGIINQVMGIVNQVITKNDSEGNFEQIQAKINKINEKKDSLIDAYANKDLTKEDFHRMNEKYNNEITELEKQKTKLKSQETLKTNITELQKDIKTTIIKILNGNQTDETFYRNILDKIIIYDRNTLEIYLNLLPVKWTYSLKNGIPNFEASVPISVNIPLTSLTGIAYL